MKPTTTVASRTAARDAAQRAVNSHALSDGGASRTHQPVATLPLAAWAQDHAVWFFIGAISLSVAAKLTRSFLAPVARPRPGDAPPPSAVPLAAPTSRSMPADAVTSTAPGATRTQLASPPRHHFSGNRWETLKQLGSGSYGRVVLMRHTITGQYAAAKEVPLDSSSSVLREFETLMALPPHEHVVHVLGVDKTHTTAGYARMFMEFCPNGSLLDVLRPGTALAEPLVRSYMRQVLEGLAFLHSHHLLHRDIKPANVLLDASGTLKIADFGLSRHMDSAVSTQSAQAGSPAYMSPEAVRGLVGVGSDLWAVGATMSHLLTGQLPWAHTEAFRVGREALLLHIGTTCTDHPLIPEHISPAAKNLLLKFFSPEPFDRGTAAEALQHPFFDPASCTTPAGASGTTASMMVAPGCDASDHTLSTADTLTLHTLSATGIGVARLGEAVLMASGAA